MNPIHVEMVIESDGVLHITDLPCRKGDRVEAVIVLRPTDTESARAAARQRFLTRAMSSDFSSTGPYPTRGELHERD